MLLLHLYLYLINIGVLGFILVHVLYMYARIAIRSAECHWVQCPRSPKAQNSLEIKPVEWFITQRLLITACSIGKKKPVRRFCGTLTRSNVTVSSALNFHVCMRGISQHKRHLEIKPSSLFRVAAANRYGRWQGLVWHTRTGPQESDATCHTFVAVTLWGPRLYWK